MQHVLAHHDALRLRFARQATGWQQVHAGLDEAAPFARVDLSALPAPAQPHALEAQAAATQASLDLAAGPLLRVVLFELGADDAEPAVGGHPPPGGRCGVLGPGVGRPVDGLHPAQPRRRGAAAGQDHRLPTVGERLTTYAQSAALRQEQAYWLAEPGPRGVTLPTDYAGGENTEASARTVTVGLSAAETQALLQEVPKAYQTQINEVLLTAVVQAFATWTGVPALRLELEGHGREALFDDVDLSRTVGWFTTIFPVRLELAAGTAAGRGAEGGERATAAPAQPGAGLWRAALSAGGGGRGPGPAGPAAGRGQFQLSGPVRAARRGRHPLRPGPGGLRPGQQSAAPAPPPAGHQRAV